MPLTQIKATIDRFEGHKGVILFDDPNLGSLAGQELVLPKRLLPLGVGVGDVVVLDFLTDEQSTQQREQIARTVLEDILNGE
ncbi:DUF3006 family protein [Candidatus Berkelbacteria bacterium]|nr:DUF3006 family protein [Candidatus Berkelbacteria bacterium]